MPQPSTITQPVTYRQRSSASEAVMPPACETHNCETSTQARMLQQWVQQRVDGRQDAEGPLLRHVDEFADSRGYGMSVMRAPQRIDNRQSVGAKMHTAAVPPCH
jgi:hypothetical protein